MLLVKSDLRWLEARVNRGFQTALLVWRVTSWKGDRLHSTTFRHRFLHVFTVFYCLFLLVESMLSEKIEKWLGILVTSVLWQSDSPEARALFVPNTERSTRCANSSRTARATMRCQCQSEPLHTEVSKWTSGNIQNPNPLLCSPCFQDLPSTASWKSIEIRSRSPVETSHSPLAVREISHSGFMASPGRRPRESGVFQTCRSVYQKNQRLG